MQVRTRSPLGYGSGLTASLVALIVDSSKCGHWHIQLTDFEVFGIWNGRQLRHGSHQTVSAVRPRFLGYQSRFVALDNAQSIVFRINILRRTSKLDLSRCFSKIL